MAEARAFTHMSQIIGSIMDLGFSEGAAMTISDELQQGWRYNVATTKARERAAAAEAHAIREAQKQKRGGGFKVVACFDQQQAFEIDEKYGPDAMFDRGFIRDMHRLCPETKCADV